MARHLLWLLPALLATGACTEDVDTGATVPASKGAIQPEGNGVEMAADEACSWLLGAVERFLTRRGGCDDIERTCPDFILPAGGSAECVTFDAGSIKACVEVIDEYATCDDFSLRPCIVTALNVDCASGNGGAGGAAGASGGGAGGAAGGSDGGDGAATGGSSAVGGSGGVAGGGGDTTSTAGNPPSNAGHGGA